MRIPGSISVSSILVLASFILPQCIHAQITWQDLVITGGLSAESYRGNLSAVTVTVVDPTERASAVVAEVGARGGLSLFSRQKRSLDFQFDLGLRQSASEGFEVRDYASREWVGQMGLRYRESSFSFGDLWIEGSLDGRRVEDPPPMPMYIQPGYGAIEGRVRFQFNPVRGISFDTQLLTESADYSANTLTTEGGESTAGVIPRLDFLDREVIGGEIGATWGSSWSLRTHSGYRVTRFRNQTSSDPNDPFRQDRTATVGATWTTVSDIFAQIGVEGTFNRSNSMRPEYDAVSFRAVVSAPLPLDINLTFFSVLTAKRYLTDTDFARLVPGEEADNASVIYLEASRPLMVNLDGAVRFGWSRAEMVIGDSYFERFGATFLLRYRPRER